MTNNNSLIGIDGLSLEFSSNISGDISQNADKNTFYVLINNFTGNSNEITINFTGFKEDYSISQIENFSIGICDNDWRENIIDFFSIFEFLFIKNWSNVFLAIMIFLVFLLTIIIFSKINK